MNQAPVVTITRYRKSDGYQTRFWAVYVDGELLAVVVYRKGAEAIRRMIVRVPEKMASRVRLAESRTLSFPMAL